MPLSAACCTRVAKHQSEKQAACHYMCQGKTLAEGRQQGKVEPLSLCLPAPLGSSPAAGSGSGRRTPHCQKQQCRRDGTTWPSSQHVGSVLWGAPPHPSGVSLLHRLTPCLTAYTAIYTQAGVGWGRAVCKLHATERTMQCRRTLSGHTWGVFRVPLPPLSPPNLWV